MITHIILAAAMLQADSTDRLIEKLSSDKAEVREEASKALKGLGKPAFEALERAAASNDPEVSSRAKELLEIMAAEQSFEQIADTLRNAKSVIICGRTSAVSNIRGVEDRETATVSLMLKGAKAVFRARCSGINSHIAFTVVSDGTRVWVKWPSKEWRDYGAPKDLNRRLIATLESMGGMNVVPLSIEMIEAAKRADFEPAYQVSGLKTATKSADVATNSFRLKERTRLVEVFQTYDPKTLRVGRVTGKIAADGVSMAGTVEFDRWDIGVDIPEREFAPPSLGTSEEEFLDKAKADVKLIRASLESYCDDNDSYPTKEQGLEALLKKPTKEPIPKAWKGPYLQDMKLLNDPWGRAYEYRQPGIRSEKGVDVFSMGPDGMVDSSDDIY